MRAVYIVGAVKVRWHGTELEAAAWVARRGLGERVVVS